MQKSKPIFRFVGKLAGGIKTQFEVAKIAQEFYFNLRKARISGETKAIPEHLKRGATRLSEYLEVARIEIASPEWFATLCRLPSKKA